MAARCCWLAAAREPLVLLLVLLVASCAWAQVQIDGAARSSVSSNVAPGAVSPLVLQSARDSLQGRPADLVQAHKLIKPPYVIYKLTLNLVSQCKSNEEPCPPEICILDVRQHEQGVIDVLQDSIQCKKEDTQEQKIIENIEKQIINQSTSFDREVQISADHNDRPFVAVRATQSDYCPGCPYELNPSLPGLSAFGEQVLQSMDEAGNRYFKHKLISIVRVTRAVPPGANLVQYQLLMEIGESNCLKSSLIQISECPLQSNLPIKLCLVTFEERPWQVGSRKITKNNCTDLLNTDNELSASVNPNSIFFESTAPNKDDDVSTKTEFYDQIAQEAQEVFRVPYMEQSTKDSVEGTEETKDTKLPHTKVILDKKKKTKEESPQFSDNIKEFDKFLSDFDIPIKTETTTSENLGEPVTEKVIKAERIEEKTAEEIISDIKAFEAAEFHPTVESIRSKRSATKALENNKSMARKLAIMAIEQVDDLDEDNKKKHVVNVTEISRERKDHNIIYYMSIEVAATDCSEKQESTECLDEVIPGPTQICKVDISTNEKKPLESPKLLHYQCKTKNKSEMRSKRQIVGAPKVHTVDDPEVQKFVQQGLRKYSATYEGDNEPIVSSIKEVTVQVVSGLLYKIKTDIGVSTCKKGITENCQLKADESIKECIIEVWSQPWIDSGNPKITVTCDIREREKRDLKGRNYSFKMLEMEREEKERKIKEREEKEREMKEREEREREEKLFDMFVKKFNKKYETKDEEENRLNIFRNNLDIIEELQRNEQGTGRYGVTQFADLEKEEFKKKYLGLKPSLRLENNIPLATAKIPDIELPQEYDWRHYNAVTPVKNQGACGSCWAFSVTGNVEGQYAIKYGKLLSFSEQELVDCDQHDDGCNGGMPDSAYRAIEELGGLELESDYPYDGIDKKCHLDRNKVRVTVASGLNITSNETQMAQWLVQNGPMSIGINANAMQFYIGGVSHPFHFLCNPDNLDHGVLIVGYGIKSYPVFKKKMPYWLIKNSWGPHWGEQGYYRVYRGDGSCGVNKMVTSAVLADKNYGQTMNSKSIQDRLI